MNSVEENDVKQKRIKLGITVLSILIPLVVAVLFNYKIPNAKPLTFLPPIYASINGLTALILVMAVLAIKKGNQRTHERLMISCIVLSLAFLIMYVAYHMTSESTSYGGDGVWRYIYFFILISHITLSIGVIPMVLITYSKAYLKDFQKHRRWAKFTFPIWLYVALTGVIVYVMISPYYAH